MDKLHKIVSCQLLKKCGSLSLIVRRVSSCQRDPSLKTQDCFFFSQRTERVKFVYIDTVSQMNVSSENNKYIQARGTYFLVKKTVRTNTFVIQKLSSRDQLS